jgi:cholesterol oxidase
MGSKSPLHEVVVIGSGFGGAISCCRMAQKWGKDVLLLERGKRYPMGSFPRSPHDMANNFWSDPNDGVKRPKHIQDKPLRGMFDVRNYTKIDALVCAGLGGGSLIYANVFLEPPDEVFKRGWPAALNKAMLQPYYTVAKSVLNARPIPPWQNDPRRKIVRTELFQEFAQNQGRTSKLADLCVFFGNNHQQATDIGIQEQNRYGATQTSCTYCAECDAGCNTHSKNTVDLNYLYVAEHVHGAQIKTDCLADKIVPLNANGEEDTVANGEHGYRVYYRDLDEGAKTVDTLRVIISAGTLGTNELLLRCRDTFGSLPRLSPQLGKRFSGNGDFLSFVIEGKKPADPNYGPVITQYTDYNLFAKHDAQRAFVLEDASYPAFLAWVIEGLQPSLNPLGMVKKFWRGVQALWRKLVQTLVDRKWSGSLGDFFNQILKDDASYNSSVLLCMGLDNGDGELKLRDGNLDLHWPQSSMPLYHAILTCGEKFKAFVQSCFFMPLPTWLWPVRSNITVHPLGGCALADSPEQGVTSANDKNRGEVFGYHGLYVADGSVLPSAVGANPIATISAVSEWIAEGITGIKPTDDLGM